VPRRLYHTMHMSSKSRHACTRPPSHYDTITLCTHRTRLYTPLYSSLHTLHKHTPLCTLHTHTHSFMTLRHCDTSLPTPPCLRLLAYCLLSILCVRACVRACMRACGGPHTDEAARRHDAVSPPHVSSSSYDVCPPPHMTCVLLLT